MKKETEIQQFFEANQGILSIRQLQSVGINYYCLNQFIAAQKIERLKPGLYRWTNYIGDDLEEALKLIPSGIACLFTAAAYYELTTFVSSQYHVAISKKRKIRLPVYPPIKLYYWSGSQLSYGEKLIKNKDGLPIRIYDKEKTVCDFQKFRNKVGMDLSKEVLKNYLNRKDRNISKLMSYAKALNISSVLQKYLEILL